MGALDDRERQSFIRKVRSSLLKRVNSGGGQVMAGPTAGPFGLMSATQPTAEESAAFNERSKNRALYGDRWNTKGGIGRPGLMSKGIDATTQKDAAKAAKGAAEFDLKKKGYDLKKREQDRKDRESGLMGVPGTTPDVTPGVTTPGQVAGPRQYGGAPATPPTQQAPAAPAPYSGGTMSFRKGTDFSKPQMPSEQPGYPYTLENQNPIGPPGTPYSNKYTGGVGRFSGVGAGQNQLPAGYREVTPPPGVPQENLRGGDSGGQHTFTDPGRRFVPYGGQPAPATVPQEPMTTINAPGAYDPGLRQKISGQTATDKATTQNRAPLDSGMWKGVDEKQGLSSATKSGGKRTAVQDALQTAYDMVIGAPVKSIGKENISAAWDTVADMMWKKPKETIEKNPELFSAMQGRLPPELEKKLMDKIVKGVGSGSKWLSQFVLGGTR